MSPPQEGRSEIPTPLPSAATSSSVMFESVPAFQIDPVRMNTVYTHSMLSPDTPPASAPRISLIRVGGSRACASVVAEAATARRRTASLAMDPNPIEVWSDWVW